MLKALSLPRMKNTVTCLFIVFLATLIFYGGAGVNLITYCCGDCRTEGVTVVLDDKCCEVHDHEHEQSGIVSGSEPVVCHAEKEDCCNLQRIYFDWNRTGNFIVQLQPAVTDLFSYGLSLFSLVPAPVIKDYEWQVQHSPPVVCPRTYLSLLTTLLI